MKRFRRTPRFRNSSESACEKFARALASSRVRSIEFLRSPKELDQKTGYRGEEPLPNRKGRDDRIKIASV
jgi:hypothetical protein